MKKDTLSIFSGILLIIFIPYRIFVGKNFLSNSNMTSITLLLSIALPLVIGYDYFFRNNGSNNAVKKGFFILSIAVALWSIGQHYAVF